MTALNIYISFFIRSNTNDPVGLSDVIPGVVVCCSLKEPGTVEPKTFTEPMGVALTIFNPLRVPRSEEDLVVPPPSVINPRDTPGKLSAASAPNPPPPVKSFSVTGVNVPCEKSYPFVVVDAVDGIVTLGTVTDP